MQWFVVVVVIAALGAAAMAAAGGLGEMKKEPVRDVFDQDLPRERPLNAAEVDGMRFAVRVRGYAMDQVDRVLDRLSNEIAARDARIAELEQASPVGAPAEPVTQDEVDHLELSSHPERDA